MNTSSHFAYPASTADLIPSLTPHLLTHYQWSVEELTDYVKAKQLHLFTCPQSALMTFLNLAEHPFEASKEAYQRITSLPLEGISTAGGFKPWMNQVFEQITSDFGEILEVEGQTYYVIFKDSE